MPKGVYVRTDEMRKNMRKVHANFSEEERQKRSANISKNHVGFLGKKHKPETLIKMQLDKLGDKNPMYGRSGEESPTFGRHHTLAAIEKMRIAGRKRRPTLATRIKMSIATSGANSFMFGKKLSEETIKKMRESRIKLGLTGEKSSNWKGGITVIERAIRNSVRYAIWRLGVFTRDNFTCQICGVRGGKLDGDHYPKKFSDILREYGIKTMEHAYQCEELWDISTGRTLCRGCHKEVHWGKKNED